MSTQKPFMTIRIGMSSTSWDKPEFDPPKWLVGKDSDLLEPGASIIPFRNKRAEFIKSVKEIVGILLEQEL